MPSLSLKASINYPFIGGSVGPSPILDGLIHYWNFNDTINITSGSAWYTPQAGNVYLKKRLYGANSGDAAQFIGPTEIGSRIYYDPSAQGDFIIQNQSSSIGADVQNWGINQGILGNSTHAGILYQGAGPVMRVSNCLYSTLNNQNASANIQALGTTFTINFWAKFDVTGQALGDVLIGKMLRQLGSSASFAMGFQGNNLLKVVSDNLLQTIGEESYNEVICSLPNYENFTDNTWRMISFVCDGSEAVFYVNASSDNGNGDNSNKAQILGSLDDQALPLNINMDASTFYTATDCLYSGIDEFGIWNRALSGAEIQSLYNGGAAKAYPF
jgi:hypothetical protein